MKSTKSSTLLALRLATSLTEALTATPICSFSSAPSLTISPVTRDPAKLAALSRLDDFHFLPGTEMPTLHFQRSLPRLPIPRLEDTCRRYLAAQRPLLKDADYERTKDATAEFLVGDGRRLQKELIVRDDQNPETSYVNKFWLESYLKDRRPLPINSNTSSFLANDDNNNDQLIRATNFLVSAARFFNSLTQGTLDPTTLRSVSAAADVSKLIRCPDTLATYHAYAAGIVPLDMSQFENLFNSTRVPKIGMDELVKGEGGHVIVLRKGHMYSVPILKSDGSIVDFVSILANLKSIKEDPRPPADAPVAAITATDRDHAHNLRKALVDAGNGASLGEIDSALFCLSLIDAAPKDRAELSAVFLRGVVDGIDIWFDKSVTMMIDDDGAAGINLEHSWGDAMTLYRFIKEIFVDSNSRPTIGVTDLARCSPTPPRSIEFAVEDGLRDELRRVASKHRENAKTLKIKLMDFHKAKRGFFKSHGLSPDSLPQLAFQMAYHRLTRTTPSTYEPCSTAAFKGGRTETIRSATLATKAAVEAFAAPTADFTIGNFRGLLDACSVEHLRLSEEAKMGQGFDRHLFALRRLAEESGDRLPNIFVDEAFDSINRNLLCTSTMNGVGVSGGRFGPAAQQGFGLCYRYLDRLTASITWRESSADGDGFCEALEISLNDILAILEGRVFRGKKMS